MQIRSVLSNNKPALLIYSVFLITELTESLIYPIRCIQLKASSFHFLVL